MRSFFVAIAACALLSACNIAPRAVPEPSMIGAESDYEKVASTSKLAHAVTVGEVNYSYVDTHKNPEFRTHNPFTGFASALRTGLRQSDLLSGSGAARYVLNADMRDVQVTGCAMVNCEAGSSVQYALLDAKTKRVVWSELVVVPFTSDKPLMSENPVDFWEVPAGGALKENIIHVTRLLGRLQPANR